MSVNYETYRNQTAKYFQNVRMNYSMIFNFLSRSSFSITVTSCESPGMSFRLGQNLPFFIQVFLFLCIWDKNTHAFHFRFYCLPMKRFFFQFGNALIWGKYHYNDVTMSAMGRQITAISNVCSTVCSGAHQRLHQSSESLVFVRGLPGHRRIPLAKGQ